MKRFVAPDMRQAIRAVRAQLGPDAVILSNRRNEAGVEIIAAMDYDELLVQEALGSAPGEHGPAGSRRSEQTAAPVDGHQDIAELSAPEENPDPAAAAPAEHAPHAGFPAPTELADVRAEVTSLRRLLECELASLAWRDESQRDPARALVLRELTALGIAADLARSLVRDMPPLARKGDSLRVPLNLLLRRLPVVDTGLLDRGGVAAVVGPTGVGKTTTVAKLAARYALRHGKQSVGLVSADCYRLGAREQLATFARILGVPMYQARDARELRHALERLSDRRLVLIDTAGMGPRDLRLASQFATLLANGGRVGSLLALSAAADEGALEEIVRVYAQLEPLACVLTKVDEAASLGPALSILIRLGLPLGFLADGQRIPEDLHSARTRRVWLLRRAVELRRSRPRVVDEQILADRFGGVASHA